MHVRLKIDLSRASQLLKDATVEFADARCVHWSIAPCQALEHYWRIESCHCNGCTRFLPSSQMFPTILSHRAERQSTIFYSLLQEYWPRPSVHIRPATKLSAGLPLIAISLLATPSQPAYIAVISGNVRKPPTQTEHKLFL